MRSTKSRAYRGETTNGSIPPNDPDNNNDNGNDCTTVTASSCSKFCISSSCTTTCRTYEGCSVKDTSIASGETPALAWAGTPDILPTEAMGSAEFASIAASVASELISMGLMHPGGSRVTGQVIFGAPTTTITVSTPKMTRHSKMTSYTPYPTNTAINVGGAYCFTKEQGYVSFTVDQGKQVVKSFCNSHYVLAPDNTYGHVEELAGDGYRVVASAKWAPNQSGCGPKEAFPFSANQLNWGMCLNDWTTDFYCMDESVPRNTSYGGAYVLNPPVTGGCILLSLYAFKPANDRLLALFMANTTMNTIPGSSVAASGVSTTRIVWPAVSTENSRAHSQSMFSQSEIAQLQNSSFAENRTTGSPFSAIHPTYSARLNHTPGV